MKKKIRLITFVMLMFAAPFIAISQQSNPPPPPNGGSGPNNGNTPVGGSAPIGGGLTIMLLLGAAYGSKKLVIKNDIDD